MNLAEKTHIEIYEFLQKEYDENKEFRQELENLYTFYGRKLMQFVKKEDQQEYVENKFGDVVNSLFFQGYYIMKMILNDEETILNEEGWKLPLGVTKNEIPLMLSSLLQDEKFDWKTDISHQFSMDILNYIEAGYETTQEITKEISEYGAYKAFIDDSRYVGNKEETNDMLLGNPNDLNFLSPQVYSKAQFFTEQHEIWDLFYWSAIRKEDSWVGSIHYSTIPVGEEKLYIIEFNLSNLIIESEKLELIDVVIKSIPIEIRSKLQIRLYNVSELDVLQANFEEEK